MLKYCKADSQTILLSSVDQDLLSLTDDLLSTKSSSTWNDLPKVSRLNHFAVRTESCCGALTSQLEQSAGQGSIPGSFLSLVHHDKGSRTEEGAICEIRAPPIHYN